MPTFSRRRRPFPLFWLTLAVLLGIGFAPLFRQGLVPPALNPLPALDLRQGQAWLVDWRLAALKYDPQLCRRILAQPQISAEPIPDNPPKQGCGWTNGVRMTSAGGVHASFDKATCEAAVALALWLTHDVQEVAQEIFGQRVASIQTFGSRSEERRVGQE